MSGLLLESGHKGRLIESSDDEGSAERIMRETKMLSAQYDLAHTSECVAETHSARAAKTLNASWCVASKPADTVFPNGASGTQPQMYTNTPGLRVGLWITESQLTKELIGPFGVEAN